MKQSRLFLLMGAGSQMLSAWCYVHRGLFPEFTDFSVVALAALFGIGLGVFLTAIAWEGGAK